MIKTGDSRSDWELGFKREDPLVDAMVDERSQATKRLSVERPLSVVERLAQETAWSRPIENAADLFGGCVNG